MRNELKARAISVNASIIELNRGDAVVCVEGFIWATTAKIACEFPPIDEFLSAGDSMISCIGQKYCISRLRHKIARYTVIRSVFSKAMREHRKGNERHCDGYILIRDWSATREAWI
jgi:hypothetical protein